MVRYSYEKLRVLSFSISHSICFYYNNDAYFIYSKIQENNNKKNNRKNNNTIKCINKAATKAHNAQEIESHR